jgi:hypothetical protein
LVSAGIALGVDDGVVEEVLNVVVVDCLVGASVVDG